MEVACHCDTLFQQSLAKPTDGHPGAALYGAEADNVISDPRSNSDCCVHNQSRAGTTTVRAPGVEIQIPDAQ